MRVNLLLSEAINNIFNSSVFGFRQEEESNNSRDKTDNSENKERPTLNSSENDREDLTDQEIHGPVHSSSDSTNGRTSINRCHFRSNHPRDWPNTNSEGSNIDKDGSDKKVRDLVSVTDNQENREDKCTHFRKNQ